MQPRNIHGNVGYGDVVAAVISTLATPMAIASSRARQGTVFERCLAGPSHQKLRDRRTPHVRGRPQLPI